MFENLRTIVMHEKYRRTIYSCCCWLGTRMINIYICRCVCVCVAERWSRAKALTKAAKELNTRGSRTYQSFFPLHSRCRFPRSILPRILREALRERFCLRILCNTFVCSRFVVLMLCNTSQVYASDISEAKKQREIFLFPTHFLTRNILIYNLHSEFFVCITYLY